MSRVYLIMGVSGSGKTTVGQALAERLGVPFLDGDDFHPPENVAKMTAGMPLGDDDRAPWLARLHGVIADHLARGAPAVVACSALKKRYRDQLRHGNDGLVAVYLAGSLPVIRRRMAARRAHFMQADMLQSQFDALEPPSPRNTLILSIEHDVATLVEHIIRHTDSASNR